MSPFNSRAGGLGAAGPGPLGGQTRSARGAQVTSWN